MLLLPRVPRRAASALLASVCAACLVAASVPGEAAPEGVGDRIYPSLGNPGYDVLAYDISLRYGGDHDAPLAGLTTIDARATARLRTFNLDFENGAVSDVRVNGARARFASAGPDITITPARPVRPGQRLRVTVRHTSDPVPPEHGTSGWVRTPDGLAMANQADAAHTVFPCNDHPADKARWTFHVTVPNGLTAVANGVPAGTERTGAATTWSYRTEHPMATELAQVSIGRSVVTRRQGPHGLPVRDVVPREDRGPLERWLRRTPGQLRWMEERVGPYPFETYGLLVADTTTGFELETQTLSLFERRIFTAPGYPEWLTDSVMVHELAHQWFGDSVSPRTWSDVWLNEGHATWYEALYAEHEGHGTVTERMHTAYLQSDAWRRDDGPPARPRKPTTGDKISIFRPDVYDGGALVLYALRQRIGTPAFERLERAWVSRYRDAAASTADFAALASEVAGRDLTGFLDAWLYGRHTPPMPGHPRWLVEAARKNHVDH